MHTSVSKFLTSIVAQCLLKKKGLKTVSSVNPPQADFPFSQVSNFHAYLTEGPRSSQVIF